MGYVGRGLNQTGGQYRKIDDISSGFDGSETSFTLKVSGVDITPTAQNLLISINGVIQEPGSAYSMNGSTITFTGAPDGAASFFGVVMGEASYIAFDTVGANEMGVTEGHVSASRGVVVDSSKNVTGFNQVTSTTFSGIFSGALSSSAQIATDISGSITESSASFSTRVTNTESSASQLNQDLKTSASPTFTGGTYTSDLGVSGSLTVGGTIIAQEFKTEFVSASITFTSGSTIFGDTSDDTHLVTGSMNISGSLTLNDGDLTVTDNVDFNGDLDVDGTTNLDNTDIDGTLTVDGGNIVFNEDSADQDFRVESNDNTHMFFVDGGNNRIGMGVGATPAFATLDIDAPGATNADNLDQSVDRATLRVRYRTDESDDGMFFGGLGSSAGYIQGVIDASNDNSSQAGKTIAINPYGGNVGIGTSNPATKFVVSSSAASTADGVALIHQAGATNRPTLVIKQDIQGGNNHDDQGLVIRVKGTSTGLGNSLRVYNRDDSATAFVVKGGGNVGIGTAVPVSGGLHIHTDASTEGIYLKSEGDTRNNLVFDGNISSAADNIGFIDANWDGTNVARISMFTGTDTSNKDDGRIGFATAEEGTVTERMRIESNGNVGIGTSSVPHPLTVFRSDSGNVAQFGCNTVSDDASIYLRSNGLFNFHTPGSGRISFSPGAAMALELDASQNATFREKILMTESVINQGSGSSKGFMFNGGGGTTYGFPNVQASGLYGMVFGRVAITADGGAQQIAKSHWGGISIIGFSGSGVQGIDIVGWGYGAGGASVLSGGNWVGSLYRSYSTSTYSLMVDVGTDVTMFSILIGI